MTEVTVATWNAGNGTPGDLLRLLGRCDVLAGQEFGDRYDDLVPAAISIGCKVLPGDLPGSRSTPLIVTPGVKVIREDTLPMLDSQDIGRGAGPDRNKPKTANGGLLEMDGVRFGAISTHLVASQQFPRRRRAARKHVEELLDRFENRPHPWFLAGDFNATPEKPQLHAMYQAGWTNTHRRDELPTHGRRAIDYVWWKRGEARFRSVETIDTHSDHRALIARFEITNEEKS